MATANPNWSEIATTTLENRSKKLADNVTNNTALTFRLQEKGRARPFGGGRVILEEIAFAENAAVTRYSGYDTLDITVNDQFSAAEYALKQMAVAVSMSGLEELQNSGPEAVIDLLGARIDNGERTMKNAISDDIYSDGTGFGGKQIGGLQLGVADAGQGTVGGIDSATWVFWRNQFFDFSANGLTAGPTTIQTAMNTLWTNLVRGRDKPDLWPADNTYFRYYLESLQPQQRFTNAKLAEAGFENLKFMSGDVVLDGGIGGSAPAAHMYALNTDYLHYRAHRDRNMTVLDPTRYATNQDAFTRLIAWAGNMTYSGRQLQGVIVA